MAYYFHILSLNCQGLRDRNKRLRLLEYLSNKKAEICFLQETHFTNDLHATILSDLDNWQVYSSIGNNVSRGCFIFIKKSFITNCQVNDIMLDVNGRYIVLNIAIFYVDYSLVTVYAPNNQKARNAFFENETTLIEDKCSAFWW